MTDHFYQSLPALSWSLKEILRQPTVFQMMPNDWEVIVTDIKGSTQAVAQGRYRDVNTIAASCVIACLNVARRHNLQIAFFYGGDGATVLVPPSIRDEALAALWTLRANTYTTYGLVLRVGSLPVEEIYEAGSSLQIAKWSVAPGYDQAVFLGDGLAYADKRIKGEITTEEMGSATTGDVNLNGLMCRWGEIKPGETRQEILCAIIQARPDVDAPAVYAEVLDIFDRVYGDYHLRHPVTAPALQPSFGTKSARYRSQLGFGGWRPWTLFRELCRTVGSSFLFRFSLSVGSFRPEAYIRSLIAATDTLHLNGTLYTIVRGTAAQRKKLRAALDQLETEGKLIYGTSSCPATVMTCYVQKSDKGHVHFLDGAGGGYTQASKEFKVKLKKSSL